MRAIIAALLIAAGISTASAQGTPSPFGSIFEELNWCRGFLSRFQLAVAESETKLREIRPKLEAAWRAYYARQERMSRGEEPVYTSTLEGGIAQTLEQQREHIADSLNEQKFALEEWRRRCDKLSETIEALFRRPRANSQIAVEYRRAKRQSDAIRRQHDAVVAALVVLDRKLDEIRRLPRMLRPQLGDTATRWPWAGTRLELYADLGHPYPGDSDLPNSNQFVVHDGKIGGGLGGTLSIPASPGFLETGFWWAIGFYFTHIHTTPTEVGNRFLPGVLPLPNGHNDMTAGLVTGGFGMRPFGGWLSPLELMILGGIGLAYNNISLIGPGGAEVLFSRYTALSWMGRLALKYWLNDYVALGLFAAYLGAQGGTANIGAATARIGGPSVWLTGITLAVALNLP